MLLAHAPATAEVAQPTQITSAAYERCDDGEVLTDAAQTLALILILLTVSLESGTRAGITIIVTLSFEHLLVLWTQSTVAVGIASRGVATTASTIIATSSIPTTAIITEKI